MQQPDWLCPFSFSHEILGSNPHSCHINPTFILVFASDLAHREASFHLGPFQFQHQLAAHLVRSFSQNVEILSSIPTAASKPTFLFCFGQIFRRWALTQNHKRGPSLHAPGSYPSPPAGQIGPWTVQVRSGSPLLVFFLQKLLRFCKMHIS
jgi:hypothetical protein